MRYESAVAFRTALEARLKAEQTAGVGLSRLRKRGYHRSMEQLRAVHVEVGAGELIVIPRGVEHRPRADAEVRFLIVGTTVTSNAAGGKPAWSHDGGAPDPA